MRTASDFDAYYANVDPWRISSVRCRDNVLRRSVALFVTGEKVLEVGCSEGHLTQAPCFDAASVKGTDLSRVAIGQAIAKRLPNATFANSDFLDIPYEGSGVIAAIECPYDLSTSEQETFFAKFAREHSGKTLIISGPIIGQNEHRKYFTHQEVLDRPARHGISVIEFHNLNVHRKTPHINRAAANVAAASVRAPIGRVWLNALPDRLIYQRCYVAR